jgi:hypothetical protein
MKERLSSFSSADVDAGDVEGGVHWHSFVASHANNDGTALCESLRLIVSGLLPPHGAGVILSHVVMSVVKLLDVVFTRH